LKRCSLGADETADIVGSLLKELSVAHIRFNRICDTQMSSSVNRIYWTIVSSILWDQSARRAAFVRPLPSTPRTARESLRAALREACQQMRRTHDDGNSTSAVRVAGQHPGTAERHRAFRYSLEVASVRRRPIPRYDGRWPMAWRDLASRRACVL